MIPVFNEEKTIGEILIRATKLPIRGYEIIIVDDSSIDSSPEIIKEFVNNFQSEHITLRPVRHEQNSGKGKAIQTAVKIAQGEYFVIQDADLEYHPEDLPALLRLAKNNGHLVVYGSRFAGNISDMPKLNYYANRFYNFLLRRLYKTKITDMHTCYKMLKTDLFKSLNITSSGFGYATELVSKLLRNGHHIEEAPIRFTGRTKKEGKKINVQDGIECAFNLIKYRFSKQITQNNAEETETA